MMNEVEKTGGTPESRSPVAPKADRLNRWLTLGANLGVVLGLIILIVEVRQNAALTLAQMETGKNDLLVEIELSLAQPETAAAWVKSIRSPESLTDVEIRQVESHLVAVMLQLDHMFQMERIGLVSREETRRHAQNVLPYYFGSRHGKNWWRWQEAGWAGTPMMEVAGPIVDGVEDDFMLRYIEGTRIEASDDGLSDDGEIVREAERFMTRYAMALREHDRPALAANYHRDGAVMSLDGDRQERSFEEIRALYQDQWDGPASFEWHGLAYEALASDAVHVTGRFDWGTPGGVAAYSYAGVLQRQDGELRIRAEVETMLPTDQPPPP